MKIEFCVEAEIACFLLGETIFAVLDCLGDYWFWLMEGCHNSRGCYEGIKFGAWDERDLKDRRFSRQGDSTEDFARSRLSPRCYTQVASSVFRAKGPVVCLAQASGLGKEKRRKFRAKGPAVCPIREPIANGRPVGPKVVYAGSQPSPLGWAR